MKRRRWVSWADVLAAKHLVDLEYIYSSRLLRRLWRTIYSNWVDHLEVVVKPATSVRWIFAAPCVAVEVVTIGWAAPTKAAV